MYWAISRHPDKAGFLVESSACVLWIGNLSSAFNAGKITRHVEPTIVIEFQRPFISIDEEKVDLSMKLLLQELVADLEQMPLIS